MLFKNRTAVDDVAFYRESSFCYPSSAAALAAAFCWPSLICCPSAVVFVRCLSSTVVDLLSILYVDCHRLLLVCDRVHVLSASNYVVDLR